MKKLVTLFAFLCLALGTSSAKNFLKNLGNAVFNKVENTVNKKMDNPEGSYAKIDTRKLEYTIPYIPVEKRSTILPKHNICSIAPAEESSDYFITGKSSVIEPR